MLLAAGRTAFAHRWGILLAVAYLAAGAMAVRSDVVVLDSLSRTAHAYFAWHNGPPKLTAIGMVWPPVTTLTLLPFTAIPALGRSGLAAPLLSAIVMAALIVFVNGELRRLELSRWLRRILVPLFAVHPMIVFYGANGMSEVWALLFPTIAVVSLVRWHRTRSFTNLSIASFACALAILTRYELGLLAVIVMTGVVGLTWLEERDLAKARATAIFFAIPLVYCVGAWMFFNWVLLGSPVWFLTGGGQIGTVAGTDGLRSSRLHVFGLIGWVQLVMWPLTFAVAGALIAYGLRMRHSFALLLATTVLYNPITTLVLAALSGNEGLTQLRYNMRAMPIALVAACWLIAELRGRWPTIARSWTAVTVACVAAAVPGGAYLMATYDHQFLEHPFLVAVTTGKYQSGTWAFNGQPIGCRGAREMGAWIEQNIHGRDSILADDSSSYGVMLFSGHPERFVDQIDRGQAYFIDQVASPTRRVKYLLAADHSFCSGLASDLITDHYAALGHNLATSLPPGLTPVHSTQGFRLLRIDHARLRRFVRSVPK